MIASSMNAMFVTKNLKNYGITKINDDHFITLVGTLYLICISFGSLLWGFIADKIPFK